MRPLLAGEELDVVHQQDVDVAVERKILRIEYARVETVRATLEVLTDEPRFASGQATCADHSEHNHHRSAAVSRFASSTDDS